VAFYEIGQPVRVNRLVDITGVSEQKARAVSAYRSQLKERPYGDISLALGRYRSLTLSETATAAEGFSVWGSDILRKIGPFSIPFQQVERLLPGDGEAGPLVSVIVRTKDRPALLSEALKSIAKQTYANIEIVLVNDGGRDVRDVAMALAGGIPVTYIAHETSRGRAAAANAGLKAAKGLYLNFLDDDDVFFPNHLETLVSCLISKGEKVAYSNALSVYFRGPPGKPAHRVKEELVFNLEFDPEILLFQNYIPIMTVLFSREVLSEAQGFYESLDLFEDWDFWIRVSSRFAFHHEDTVTAEYRFYNVPDAETAHRQKYRYDTALAAVFDRTRPLLSGKAWVNFLKNGSMGRFRLSGLADKGRIAELEDSVAACQEEIRVLNERLEKREAYVLETGIAIPPCSGRGEDRRRIERVKEGARFIRDSAFRVWFRLITSLREWPKR
jgi:glycosyltransferase involved in cell wall biosynthesis